MTSSCHTPRSRFVETKFPTQSEVRTSARADMIRPLFEMLVLTILSCVPLQFDDGKYWSGRRCLEVGGLTVPQDYGK